MAYNNLLTYAAAISSVEQVYYAPVAVVPPYYNVPLSSLYCFLASVDPWANNAAPPMPTQDQKSIKSIFKNIFVAKEITSNDISPVIQRIDWTANTTYDYYRDDVDMFALNNDGSLVYNFYVHNSYDQVFKCLWNNNDAPSTVQPYFEPGTYGTNNIFQGADNYKWKYMYTIDIGTKDKFMDANWLPIPVGANTPNPLLTSAGSGDIEVINVMNQGTGYDPANAVISVVITGDGTGATATANVVGGSIVDVIVTNPGTNYSYSNVIIQSTQGSNATAIGPTSPIGGHSFDPISELGCSRVMFSVEFNGTETNTIPVDITYYQIGIVIDPTTQQLNPLPANGTIYKTTTDVVVSAGFGRFQNSEIVYQGDVNNPTFTGTVLYFDPASDVINMINTTGTVTTNAPIFGKTSLCTRTVLTYSTPNFVLYSGYMSYIENRSGITRSSNGIEQFKLVLGY
jgi:hypothetical protein